MCIVRAGGLTTMWYKINVNFENKCIPRHDFVKRYEIYIIFVYVIIKKNEKNAFRCENIFINLSYIM